MGLRDLFSRNKVSNEEETYKTSGGREVQKKDVGEFVLKVNENGGWNIPPLGGQERRTTPIYIDEVDEIDSFDGVRCDILDKNGKILGQLWKKMNKKQQKTGFGSLEGAVVELEKMNNLNERLRNALGGGGADDDVKAILNYLVQEKEANNNKDMITSMKEMYEVMNQFDSVKTMFSGQSNNLPAWLQVMKDPVIMSGIKETVGGLARTVGQEVQVGQNQVTHPNQVHSQPNEVNTEMTINDFPDEDEAIIVVDDHKEEEPVDEVIIVEEKVVKGKRVDDSQKKLPITDIGGKEE